MSRRRVQIVLICEDSQQDVFVRRFLNKRLGVSNREIRPIVSPKGRGSGEQWVRENFPRELGVYRERSHRAATTLIAMIDADTKSVLQRKLELEKECQDKQIEFRKPGEAVAILVPKRNIETWIHYFNGESVNEVEAFSRLKNENDCKPAVADLDKQCRSGGLQDDAPPSLNDARKEYRERIVR